MTKQLPQKIDDAVLKVAMSLTKNKDDIEQAIFTINHYLWEYLSLPKEEEQTELADDWIDEAIKYFEWTNDNWYTTGRWPMTPKWKQDFRNAVLKYIPKQEQEDTLSDKIHKWLIEHYEEDTTPIEKIDKISDKLLSDIIQWSADEVIKRINNMK